MATLITPNQRAARTLRQAHDRAEIASGQTLWHPAEALPLEAWLGNLWHQHLVSGADTRMLLNRTQEHALWADIIRADTETPSLRSPDALADLAARAWSLAHLYNARPRLRDFAPSTDSRAFDRWSRAFDRRLQRGQWITAAQLPAELAAANLTLPPVTLVDFDTPPPAIAALFQSVPGATHQETTVTPTLSSLHAAADDASELIVAATWARIHLDANPSATIAIVVPNLADRRAAINRAFAPILSPETLSITARPTTPAYEFSLGRPLAELPIAQTALTLLTWPLQPLPLETISALLLSPWFASEPSNLAAFDAFELRQTTLLRPELSLQSVINLLTRSRRSASHAMSHLLNLQRAARSIAPNQSFMQWADTFRTLLEAAGLPRHARSSSLAYQQHSRFESALDELATLDFDAKRPDASEALAAFSRILHQTVFATESTNAPVQILGPIELGGTSFDALWFLGADDLVWPTPIATTPLIPWPLQRTLAMPGADRKHDHAHAQALTNRIAHSATEVIFSYARQSEEGDRRPSPLLATLNLIAYEAPEPVPTPPTLPFEIIPDDLDLPPLPAGPVRGGANILKLQAACAFRAFAETRLHASQPETADPGLDALERGNIVHKVMEQLWTVLGTQSNLRDLPTHKLSNTLNQAIDLALSRITPETAWDEAYLRVQRQRLRDLLLPWLAIERERPPFTVQPPEQKKHFQLGPLELELRIDRIDATARGLVILDYKTGVATPASWKTTRPDEPQLPLYSVLTQQSGQILAGVAFAQLRPGDGLGITGYADDDLVFGRKTRMEAPTLAEQVEDWHTILTGLATAYAAGDTRVAPRSYPKTCAHCHQRILCRLNPDLLLEDEEEREEEPIHG